MPLPPHILGFMQSQCRCFVCPDSDEMDVDLRSTKDAVLFKLLNLLEDFAQQQSKVQRLEEKPEPPKIEEVVDASDAVSSQLEEGEIVDDMDIVSCLVVVDNVPFSSLPKQEEDDELIDICGVSPVSVNKSPQTSPSSSSSSSSDSSSSSSSGATSGSSCSGSSSSSDSDSLSDSDEYTATSSPEDTSDLPIEAEVNALEQQQVTEQDKGLITERAASPDTEMQELIARAQEKQKLHLVLERERAREQLEEMKRTAQPVYDSIDPRLMKQLGISKEVEYMVSPVFSRDSVHLRAGGLLQKLGLFLKE